MSNVDRRSTVPKFDDLTLLENGDSALFPDWSLENLRQLKILLILFSDFLVDVLVKINLLHYLINKLIGKIFHNHLKTTVYFLKSGISLSLFFSLKIGLCFGSN